MTKTVTALVPAHNEERNIAHTIASLQAQTHQPDHIIVIADNCTDLTVQIARDAGVEVYETVDNTDKKAGALNQVLHTLLATLDEDDFVFVMDADSTIRQVWLERALQDFDRDSRIGGVGGIFLGEQGHGMIGLLQRNEFTRYRREIIRRDEKAKVLTGTASMFRVAVLNDLVEARREKILPGEVAKHSFVGVYDTNALTEDNEVGLAIQHRGWKITSPEECGVVTEVMTTWKDLFRQRLRWQRGALENLRAYGYTKVTRSYIGKQALIYAGIIGCQLFIALMVMFAIAGVLSLPHGIWIAVTGLFFVERVITVRYAGWRSMIVAATFVFEFFYDCFMQAVFVRAAWDSLRKSQASWT